jgi:hypothetical protein
MLWRQNLPPDLCLVRYLSIPFETLLLVCAFSSLCARSCLRVLKKKFSVVHFQPGGIRRTFDTPPPRQLTHHIRLVQALLSL